MENIIWILIIILVIQKIMARAARGTHFPDSGKRIPGDSLPGNDEPLPGPWNRRPPQPETPGEYDAPVPGPWNRESGQQTKEAFGEQDDEDNRGLSQDRNNREIVVQQETVQFEYVPERENLPPEQKRVKHNQRREVKAGRRTGNLSTGKVVPPLYRYLNNRHALAASVIISEVFNKRGGRSLRNPPGSL